MNPLLIIALIGLAGIAAALALYWLGEWSLRRDLARPWTPSKDGDWL